MTVVGLLHCMPPKGYCLTAYSLKLPVKSRNGLVYVRIYCSPDAKLWSILEHGWIMSLKGQTEENAWGHMTKH